MQHTNRLPVLPLPRLPYFPRLVPFAVLAVLLSSCAIRVDLPRQFLVTSRSSSEFKATTADNAIFWVQRYDLPEDGDDLSFWVAALKNDFVENRGYVLIEEEKTRTQSGVDGVNLVFETTTQGRTYRQLMAVFIEDGLWHPVAWAARFTAEKTAFAEHVDAVKKAIRTTGI